MKSLTSFLLVVVLVFGFTGCANQASVKKKQSVASSAVTATIKSTSGNSETQSARNTEALQTEENTAKYIGNKNSHKFHRTNCGVLPAEKNRVYFQSREDAIDRYYKSCKKCNP